jgi:hypothetical protein
VRAAQADSERQALDRRFGAALTEAAARGAEEVVRSFEAAARGSKAVIARPLRDVDRIVSSDRELFATFYGLTEGGVRLPFGDKWDHLRQKADATLFPGYQKQIRFAALSLDGVGLAEFGDCSLVLREDMIAHRATVFEENSASFLERNGYHPPEGCRATWTERSKLCTSKNAGDLRPGMPDSSFPAVVLRQKKGTEESRFVEVHIFESMSIHAVEKAVLTGRRSPGKRFVRSLRDRLAKFGADLEER